MSTKQTAMRNRQGLGIDYARLPPPLDSWPPSVISTGNANDD
jgi:hypothetical protein